MLKKITFLLFAVSFSNAQIQNKQSADALNPYNTQAIQYDYSAKQWNGMVSTFYKPRWEKFISFLTNEMKKDTATRYKEINSRYGRPANEANHFYRIIYKWEADRANTPAELTRVNPAGNEISMVQKLYNKWKPVADRIYESKTVN